MVELFDSRRATVARRAYPAGCEVVVADEIFSRIVAQSVRQRGLGRVFVELTSVNLGNALYVRQLPGESGASFGDLRRRFDRAIPIGTLRAGEPRPRLAPDPDTVLAPDDLLVFLARRYEEAVIAGKAMQARAPQFSMHWFFARVYWQQGLFDEALEEDRQELARRGHDELVAALDAGLDTAGPTGAMRAVVRCSSCRVNSERKRSARLRATSSLGRPASWRP